MFFIANSMFPRVLKHDGKAANKLGLSIPNLHYLAYICNMVQHPLISVIVPVYNVKDYLANCIDSILRQSYKEIEIILIDDGSNDGSESICDRYKECNARIKVLHTGNAGQSHARNVGITLSRGDYILFVDSDDTIAPECVSILYDMLSAHDADISMAGWILTKSIPHPPAKETSNVCKAMTGMEAAERMLYQNKLNSGPVGKLFKKELFQSFLFEEGIIYEDLELLARMLPSVSKVVWSDIRLYYYTIRQDSTIKKFTLRRLDVLYVTDKIEKTALTTYPNLLAAARDRKLSANFNMLQLLAKNGYSGSCHANRCWNNIRNLRKYSLVNPKVRLKNKIGILLSYSGKTVFQFLSKILP